MQDVGYTIVVYNQEDTGNKVMTRSLAGIFSPGTCFSDDQSFLNNNTTCIWIDFIENKGLNHLSKGNYIVIGIANINIYTGQSVISQSQELFIDNPTTYDNLERFISVYNPSEVIIISNLKSLLIQNMVQYINLQCKKHIILFDEEEDMNCISNKETNLNINVKRAKDCEKIVFQEQVFKQTFDFTSFANFTQLFYGHHIAQSSFCFLIDFIQQHNPQLVKNIDKPIVEIFDERLVLANHSLKQ
jgi:DNA mismatch repair protein MutS